MPFRKHSLLIYLLKLNSNFTVVEYVTTATRVLVGKIEKYSIKFSTNFFSKTKLLEPMLPDLSMTNTMSCFAESITKDLRNKLQIQFKIWNYQTHFNVAANSCVVFSQLSFVRYDVSFKLVHRLSFRILYHLYMCKIYTGNFHLQNSPAMDHLHYRLNFDLDKNFITA